MKKSNLKKSIAAVLAVLSVNSSISVFAGGNGEKDNNSAAPLNDISVGAFLDAGTVQRYSIEDCRNDLNTCKDRFVEELRQLFPNCQSPISSLGREGSLSSLFDALVGVVNYEIDHNGGELVERDLFLDVNRICNELEMNYSYEIAIAVRIALHQTLDILRCAPHCPETKKDFNNHFCALEAFTLRACQELDITIKKAEKAYKDAKDIELKKRAASLSALKYFCDLDGPSLQQDAAWEAYERANEEYYSAIAETIKAFYKRDRICFHFGKLDVHSFKLY